MTSLFDPKSAQEIPDSRFFDYSKKGAEGTIKKIVIYKGPTSTTLQQQAQQSSQNRITETPQEPKSENWLSTLLSILFPESQKQSLQIQKSDTQKPSSPYAETITNSGSKSSNSPSLQSPSSPNTYYQRPGKPIPISPGSEYEPGQKIYTSTPTLTWEPAPKAQYYSLAISRAPYGPENILYSREQITGTSVTLPENVLIVGENYRWNMYAYNTAGRSDISWTLYFNLKQSH